MRLVSLEVNGFRAFAGGESFDLDADSVIVVGANGQGKTSLFDAILWGLTGDIPRLRGKSVVSLFSDSGEARVALRLRDEQGNERTLIRSFDGSESTLRMDVNGESVRGPEASSHLLRALWPEALTASKPQEAFVSALERAVYLQQDTVRGFIETQSEQERFATVSELVGAGRINELQIALDRSRTAWSTVTGARENEARQLRERIDALEDQLTRIGGDLDEGLDSTRWGEWWNRVRGAGVSTLEVPQMEAGAAASLDAAVKELQAQHAAASRTRQDISVFLVALEELGPEPVDDVDALRKEAEEAAQELETARGSLAHAEQQAAELRRRQVEAADAREQLRALAQLALRHLGERCPVCTQEYDQEFTRQRLEQLALGDQEALLSMEVPDIPAHAAELERREQIHSEASRRLAEAESRLRQWQAQRGDLESRARQLGVGDTEISWRDAVASRLYMIDQHVESLERDRNAGEQLALALARAGQRVRRREIEQEVQALLGQLAGFEAEITARRATTDRVAELLDGLRGATADVVDVELKRLEPLLQRIYSTADPHPAFRVVRLLSQMKQRRGRVVPTVGDPVREVETDAPEAFLSSSQLNVLAVSIFLALNLGMRSLPLKSAMLDDPLQSLDDVNLLGLIDLFRRTRECRQLILSTHDARFGGLLERKLRPIREEQRTLVINLDGWSPEGLRVAAHEVPRQATPIQIAA